MPMRRVLTPCPPLSRERGNYGRPNVPASTYLWCPVSPPDPSLEPMTARAWLLFALCSAVWGVPYRFIKLGLIAFFRLIAEAGPSRPSVVTYVNPLVAVV